MVDWIFKWIYRSDSHFAILNNMEFYEKITNTFAVYVFVFFFFFSKVMRATLLLQIARISTVVIHMNWINGDVKAYFVIFHSIYFIRLTDKSDLTTHFRYELWIRILFCCQKHYSSLSLQWARIIHKKTLHKLLVRHLPILKKKGRKKQIQMK